MDEILSVLIDIKNELMEMNQKLDSIQGIGAYNSIADVCDKLDELSGGESLEGLASKIDEIKGTGIYDTVADVCDKLDAIKGSGIYDSISDVCEKLDTIDTSISMLD